MQLLSQILIISIIFSLSGFYSCGGKVERSLDLQQKAAKILDEGSPWGGLGNVEVLASPSGVDPSELSGLQVVFDTGGSDGDWAPTDFLASGADDFLKTDNSNWIWTGSGTEVITLSEASVSELTSVDVSEDAVTFTFEVSQSNSGGRISGIDGYYTVVLK